MREKNRKKTRHGFKSDSKQRQKAHKPAPTNIEIELDITALTHDGRGIGHSDGKTVFVDGALPTEKVKAKITHQKKRYDEAVLSEILISSQHRVVPKCEFYSQCGGCSLQHLERLEQLNVKEEHLINNLQRLAGITVEELMPAISASQWQYRRKARLATSYDKREKHLVVGFREKESSNIIQISHCEILAEPFSQNLARISQIINTLDKKQYVSHIDLIKASNQNAIVIRHVKALSEADIKKLTRFSELEELRIFLQNNNGNLTECSGEDAPELFVDLKVYDISITFTPSDFIQINAEVNEMLLTRAISLLDLKSDDVLLDLYCGLGNFSLPIARQAREVIGIEGSNAMVESARSNAVANAINNAEFYCADLTKDISGAAWFRTNEFNKVILDPPRAGAFDQMIMIGKLKPKKIVYISCDPSTLARDIGELASKFKYRVKKAGIIDMFPNTSHVESIVLLERK